MKKTYVITVNPRFENPIIDESKIHTIRKNYDFWEKRIEKINRGEGVLSIRVWTGKPYRSPQREIARLEKAGIEKVIFTRDEELLFFDIEMPGYYETLDNYLLAKNDGLSLPEFIDWFKDYPEGEMALIHFTSFRYQGDRN
jgi:hypothetical protein